jgi:hypothetical protein
LVEDLLRQGEADEDRFSGHNPCFPCMASTDGGLEYCFIAQS